MIIVLDLRSSSGLGEICGSFSICWIGISFDLISFVCLLITFGLTTVGTGSGSGSFSMITGLFCLVGSISGFFSVSCWNCLFIALKLLSTTSGFSLSSGLLIILTLWINSIGFSINLGFPSLSSLPSLISFGLSSITCLLITFLTALRGISSGSLIVSLFKSNLASMILPGLISSFIFPLSSFWGSKLTLGFPVPLLLSLIGVLSAWLGLIIFPLVGFWISFNL